ncbi:lytic transglycosylase domain-containing protein [Bacillus sp. 2205SS5-2]|uniref:lytic transglycosylase domain-containing protein n=1 Tax=Bacillus sp. 2205SS5-2 TaxID=3109031 RepID=UPI003007E097
MKKKQKKQHLSYLIIGLIPVVIFSLYYVNNNQTLKNVNVQDSETKNFIDEIPGEFIPIYQAAEEEYGVQWTLLAAHHRVETRFSKMEVMVSPVGAIGPMQFMPCTFVGWGHPTCDGLGGGDITDQELTNPDRIKEFGGYGVDANGDGIADPWDIEDAIFTAAKYLARNGASEGEVEKAVFAYNHSDEYVESVMFYLNKYEKSLEEDSVPTTVW